MDNSGFQWGWRASCLTLGCKKTCEGWGGLLGPPAIPTSGGHTSGPLKGWFVQFRARYRYLHGGDLSGPQHLVFCPDHAPEVIAWQATYQTWERERYGVGKEVSLSLFARIAEWLSPEKERQAEVHRQTGDAVRAWTKTHPAPQAPWLR
jgi:hypothetical protein